MTLAIDGPHTCFVCGRRNDGVAIADRRRRLRWICNDCGPPMAKRVASLSQAEFDVYEARAVDRVVKQIGEGVVTIEPEDLTAFVRWTVEAWCVAVRDEAEELRPPF